MVNPGDEPPPHRGCLYPTNITDTAKSKHALKLYRELLDSGEARIFASHSGKHGIFIWDLPENDIVFHPVSRITSREMLDKALSASTSNPSCRFIFLYTASSRGKLDCTRGQLTSLLDYHGVMPAFLDFCFEFKNREKAATTSKFRFEDFFAASSTHEQQQQQSTSLRQSAKAMRMQHAFNVMAPEPGPADEDGNRSWVVRHTTVYHSFDITNGKSVWIIIKSNDLIRDRITSSEESPDHNMTREQKRAAQFASTLAYHLSLLEWCTENWGSYIDLLGQKATRHATAIKLAPVEAMSRTPPKKAIIPWPAPELKSLGFAGKIRSNLSRAASGFSTYRVRPTNPVHNNIPSPQPNERLQLAEDDEDENLDEHFRFDDLQSIRKVTDEAEEARMMINENRRILTTLHKRYSDLARLKDMGAFMEFDQGHLESILFDFCQQLSVLQGDLDSLDARLQLLLKGLERNEEMFQAVLQYGNMRVGEHYSRLADDSAKTMERWTVKMHDIAAKTEHETNSMHGITVLTLIFLPGTFVSTLFSSGIWNFDDTSGTRMGDWETRVPALKLFFVICIPLMGISLSVWMATYLWGKRHRMALTKGAGASLSA